ncbi:cytosine permease [Arthrobacter sp. OAP107]|uniref:purine-cytosine permease family protein n=1 Tax=Arthrobacter sp. OAP107 TaxID=3156445 RepID=UPI003399759A
MRIPEQASDEGVDAATHAIPDEARTSKLSLTMSWWGVASGMIYLFLGATMAVTYGTINTIIALVLTVISYGIINSVLARYSLKTGLSVALFSRVLFGRFGALLATAVFFLTAMFYAIFEGSVIAVAASSVLNGLSYSVAAFLVVLYSVPLAIGSVQNFLDKLNGVLLPIFAIGLVAAVVATVARYGYSSEWLNFVPAGGAPAWGWLHAYIGYMGAWILMMFTFDFARFGKKRDVAYHTHINFGFPFYLMAFLINGLVGIFLVAAGQVANVSETGVVEQLLIVLGGGWGLLFIWATQTRINSANFHLATVNMHAFFDRLGLRLGKVLWALIVGACVLVMMSATDVFSYLQKALTYQGVFVTAWVAVAMVHILSRRYRSMFGDRVFYRSDEVPAINPAGLTAWLVGAGVGVALTLAGLDLWAPVVTVVLTSVLYATLQAVSKPAWYAIDLPSSELAKP